MLEYILSWGLTEVVGSYLSRIWFLKRSFVIQKLAFEAAICGWNLTLKQPFLLWNLAFEAAVSLQNVQLCLIRESDRMTFEVVENINLIFVRCSIFVIFFAFISAR